MRLVRNQNSSMCRPRWQRYLLQALLLYSFGSLSLASVHPAERGSYPQSAKIGEDGFVVYEVFQKGAWPDHEICESNDYNCTTPHGLCKDEPDKYRIVVVKQPVPEEGGHTWFCGIKIKEVSFNDVGMYAIWKLTGVWNQGQHDVYFTVWKMDDDGRICQTSYDEISEEIVNNCTSLTTQAITTEPLTTEEEEETTSTTKAVESLINTPTTGGGSNDAIKGPKNSEDNETCTSKRDMILTAVGVFIGTLAFVAVILAIRQVRKRRRRSRFDPYEGYSPGLSMGSQPVANGAAHHENDVA